MNLTKQVQLTPHYDAVKCKGSNKPCGDRCIPQKQNCKVGERNKPPEGKKSNIGSPSSLFGFGVIGAAVGHDVAAAKTISDYNNKKRYGGYTSETEKNKAEENESYEALGVKKGASKDDLKKAYRDLSRKYHPDTNKDPDAAKKMTAINTAYDKLTGRNKYDSLLAKLNEFVRTDGILKCKAGNKPCGKICIPQKSECNADKKGNSKGVIASIGAGALGWGIGGYFGKKTGEKAIRDHEQGQQRTYQSKTSTQGSSYWDRQKQAAKDEEVAYEARRKQQEESRKRRQAVNDRATDRLKNDPPVR